MNNYDKQVVQAKKLFQTYDQQELITRCNLRYDENYFYITFLSEPCRICRVSGDMERFQTGKWTDGNGFNQVMTILDWLCDSKQDRYITGNWINVVNQGPCFHTDLQENDSDPNARFFDEHPEAFKRACQCLGGEKLSYADISYAIELVDGLKVCVQLWHSDEEFPPNLRLLWDANVGKYLRYETTWYAAGLLLARIKEKMQSYILESPKR